MRIVDHDYPAIMGKENEWQNTMAPLLTEMVALDSKIVASLEAMAAKDAVRFCIVVNI